MYVVMASVKLLMVKIAGNVYATARELIKEIKKIGTAADLILHVRILFVAGPVSVQMFLYPFILVVVDVLNKSMTWLFITTKFAVLILKIEFDLCTSKLSIFTAIQ